MDDLLTPPPPAPQTRYLRAKSVMKRYDISALKLYRMRTHPDPLKRFPRPTMILGSFPLWSERDLDAYDAAHRK